MSSKLKIETINKIIDIEGDYVNDPSDSGGETNFGITISVARANGYRGSMKRMSRGVAFSIYAKQYWDKLNLDTVEALSPLIAKELADTSVNMGAGRAGKFLQRSLNVLNNRGKHYDDLVVDGAIGANTINALREYLSTRDSDDEKILYQMLNNLQGAFYVTLAERREKDEKFIYGWYKHRIS